MSRAPTGGELVVEALRREGVRHVFGIPGFPNLAVYDALLGQGEIHHVLARHEAGAAFMADGYARASGEPGVVLVTTGPGATNALTPLVESYAGSVPVVLIASDIASDLVGRDLGALHEVPDQIECFRPVARWAEAVTEARAIPGAIAGAFDLLRTGRNGPMVLSIPYDLLNARVAAPQPTGGHGARPPCHVADVEQAVALLARAARPLIVAGGGVIAAGATRELQALARRLGAPVVATVAGRGAVSEREGLFQGVLPDRRACGEPLRSADVLLAVGTKFGHRSLEKLGLASDPGPALIHLDLDPAVIGRVFKTRVALVGDARDGLGRILDGLGDGAPAGGWDRAWLARLRADAGPGYSRGIAALIDALRATLPDDAIVAADQTGLAYWMEWRFPILRPRTFLYPTGSASLGYAVPAAIGAKVACPDRAVLAVAGDGGFMYSVNELATAVKYRLPVVFLVVNDERFGAIRWLQERLFGRAGEAELTNPDFPALATAFGCRGERVDATTLGEALGRALDADGPTLLELPLAVDPPWEMADSRGDDA
jgi:acetolactate synthase-1/2/3 large subunit